MSGEAGFTRSWAVGRYTATLSVAKPRPGHVTSAVIEWEPRVPSDLTPAEMQQYREGRAAALVALGMTAAVVEL